MKALIVDDDRVIADLIAFTLRKEGFEISLAFNGETAVSQWRRIHPDILILDVNLPGRNGFAVCQTIRSAGDDTPIIMLTVRGDEEDVIHGLHLGADDYIHKPFSPRQLVARVQAVLRRAGKEIQPAVKQVGVLCLDMERREVRVGGGGSIMLTPLEARLLNYMMLNAGHILTNEALLTHVWGAEGGSREMLRQLVRRLRGKIEPDPAQPIFIETIAGLGYGLVDPLDS